MDVILKDKIKDILMIDPVLRMKVQASSSLYFFVRYFWDCYSSDKFVDNWHLKKLSEELEIVARRVSEGKPKLYDLIINVPPGTTKTGLVSIFFPIWCWVNWPWMRFITTSHSDFLSRESAEYSRDIIRHDKFRYMFPEIDIRGDKDVKSNFRIVYFKDDKPHQGGGRVSTSVGARIIGFHAHIIIPDDIIDPRGVLSEATMKTANNYLDQTLSTRKVDKKVTATIMIMQRLHQNDPTGHLLAKKKKKIKHICLPGEIKNYYKFLKPQEWDKYYSDDGLFDINRLDWDTLEDLEMDLGQYGYSGQIGQNPVPAGGGMFKVDHIQVLNRAPHYLDQEMLVRYWDKAGSKDSGAYTVGVKMCKLKSGVFVVLDVKRGQWASNEREAIIKECAIADGDQCMVFVEQEPGSGGKESAEATIRNLAGYNVYADRPTGDKVSRADPLSVQVNNGNVQIIAAEWNYAYIEELRNFPLGHYKDQVDASSGSFAHLSGRKMAKVW